MKRLNKFIIIVILIISGHLWGQTMMTGSTESTAGGQSQSTNYVLQSAVGQPAPVGVSSGTNFLHYSGFLFTITEEGDITAPAAPLNMVVTPGEWTSNNDFEVSWQKPSGDPTIAGAYYKLGSAPTNRDDGTFIAGDISQLTGITLTSPGETVIYVWLKDLAGNYSHLNTSLAYLKYDNELPYIQHTAITSANIGADIQVNANSVDGFSGIKSFDLNYRETGDASGFESVAFVADQAQIPAAANTQRGVEYFISAEDSAGNIMLAPEVGFYSIQISLTGEGGYNLTNTGQPVIQHNGTTASDYRIFSTPLILDNPTPASVFEDDLGSFDDTKWKIFDVVGGTIRDYNTIRNLSIVQPGKGFLLLLNMTDKYVDTGPGQTPNAENYRFITLNSGWNLIGNPFDFDIPLDSLEVDGSIPEAWYLSSGGWINNPTHLKKWEGLAIFSQSSSYLKIGVGSGSGYQFAISEYFAEDNWGMKMSARGNSSIDSDNYIGVYTAENPPDKLTWHEPPRIGGAVALKLTAEETSVKKPVQAEAPLSGSFRQAGPDGNFWDFEILGEANSNSVTLDLTEFGVIPSGYKKILIDKNVELAYDLEQQSTGLIIAVEPNQSKRFRILIGSEQFARKNSDGVSIYPVDFAIRKIYPNPFNPDTKIVFSLPEQSEVTAEVFNVAGQKVRQLTVNKQFMQGYHQVSWNGRNDSGQFVSSGMYLFRVRAGEKIKVAKGVLIK